jgi:LacI family transcriptional regulator
MLLLFGLFISQLIIDTPLPLIPNSPLVPPRPHPPADHPPSRHVALLIGTSGAYARGLLRGIARFNREGGNWLTYHWPHGLHTSVPPWLRRWPGDGIIARVGTRRLANGLARLGVPIVNLRSAILDLPLPRVGPDNTAVAQLAAEHLLALGLTDFAFCNTPRGFHLGHDARADAFVAAVTAAGYRCDVYHAQAAPGQASSAQETRQLIRWLSGLPKPVGVMACNDEVGVTVLGACREAEFDVPGEIAVLGVDNDEALCDLSLPPLTSIDANAEHVGYEAALLLSRMMNGEAHPTAPIYVLPRGVVSRPSTDALFSGDAEVDRALAFIRENAPRRLLVSHVAAHVSLSRASLEPRFRKALGRTIHEEIQRVRLNRAKALLAGSTLPIKQVAAAAGFAGVPYLNRVFRRATGETPARYRRRRS